MGGSPCCQPYRLEIEYNHSVSVHRELYPFLQQDISAVKELAYKKGAMVWDSANRKENPNSKFPKSKFVFIKFRSTNPVLIRQLQENLENLASYSKFNHERLHYLFTSLGKVVLEAVGKTTFLFWNARNNYIYIYGSAEVQEETKTKLKEAIEHLSTFPVLDKVLLISKKKLGNTAVISKIHRATKQAGLEHCHLSGNRLLVSGSEEAFNKLKAGLKKDGLLFQKQESALSRQWKGRPECTICTLPPDADFVRSILCEHVWCVDCIQGYFDMMRPQFPAKCHGQGCAMLMGIGDIVKVGKKESLKKLLELAVVKYQVENPDKVFTCPKPDCGQLLCANNKTTGEYGGEFYFCDECVSTYCIPCSLKAEKAVKSHEFNSCEEARNGFSDQVHDKIKTIQETIFNLRCPRCSTSFFEFTGCAAVVCETCGCGFCGLCLQDCGNDAHSHVVMCSKNPARDFFVSEQVLNKVHREMRVEKVVKFLQDIIAQEDDEEGRKMAESIVRALRRDLIDLGITEEEIMKRL